MVLRQHPKSTKDVKPDYFIFENVPGFMTTYIKFNEEKRLIPDVVKELLRTTYSMSFNIIDTQDYGVPQSTPLSSNAIGYWASVSAKRFSEASGKFDIRLSWTHYRVLLQVNDPKARAWYMAEAAAQTWSTRTLQRNIDSQYYYRLLQSQHKDPVEKEMLEITAPTQVPDKLEFVKNPVVAEFLGLESRTDFTENTLEGAIISNLQKFLMELGKGFAFVAHQQHIHTEKQDYYIDLVFYNYILKCFCLIDLKTSRVTHQDVGQMDMYVRMYDELKRSEGDNPTIGIILCSETDEDIARYSVLHGNEQLFASKYKLYLPSEEELRAEIEAQKTLYYLQQAEEKKTGK